MRIILAKHAGFCDGVKNAVSIALLTCDEYGRAYSNHPLIHNKKVVENLEKKGLFVLKKEPHTGDVVVISTHGASKKKVLEYEKNGVTVIDATCPLVKKVKSRVTQSIEKGDNVIILGDKNHAEIKGITEDYPQCKIVTEPCEEDFSREGDYLVVSQTTFSIDKLEDIRKKIKKIAVNSKKTVVFFDSICYTTLWRQSEAKSIAEQADIMLVVGDKTSANTQKLADICRAECAKTYLIENVTDLKTVQIENNYEVLGIVSGASTPKELIMEVFYIMSEIKTTDEVKVEEVTAAAEAVSEVKEEKKANHEEVHTMAEAMKKYSGKTYREGMRITAKVVSVDPTGISVAIEGGGKNDSGFISKDEAEIDGTFDANNYKVGDEIKCIIIPKEPGVKNNSINLSKKAYDAAKIDDEHVQRILAGEEFTLSSTQEVKGGLIGKIGTYSIFIPASQIRLGFVKNLADYTNKTLRLVALPPKEELDEEGNPKKPRNSKRIVASQKVILEREKAEKENEFWSGIYEGAIVSGKVKRFASFGAFVNLKYMDGLVHCTDLSWSKKRVTDPSEILELNKTYDFIVLSADRETGKISLGYKQLQKKPYEIAQEKYPVGSVVTGKVARIVKFGAFVELEPGIDGLVHVSQIKNGWIENAGEVLKEGDEVQVKVMAYDGERITLSIKELLPEEPAVTSETEEENAPKGKKEDRKFKKKENKEDDGEPREYVSGSHGVTLGDVFKNLSLKNED